jgi:hypothetical protein
LKGGGGEEKPPNTRLLLLKLCVFGMADIDGNQCGVNQAIIMLGLMELLNGSV